jgi:AraC family transcriptional regulator
MDHSRDDERVIRSAHNVVDVSFVTRFSNDIQVHSVEFGLLPGPAWADLSSHSHARIAIPVEEIGGRVEGRLKPHVPSSGGVNMVSFTPPGTPVWGYGEGVRRVRDVRLDFDFPRVCEALGQRLTAPSGPLLFRDDRVRYLARCLAEECKRPDALSSLYVDHLTTLLCIGILRLSTETPSRVHGSLAPWQLRRATEYIMGHLSEAVRLRDLADLTGLSQSQFGRAFKVSTGVSPYQWQLKARIERAQQLLVDGDRSLAQIALDTGFSEQSHLTRVFRNIVGATPRSWQRDRRR